MATILSPEPMRHLAVVVLASDLEEVTRAIASEGVLHLMDVRQWDEALPAVHPFDVSSRLNELESLRRQVDRLCTALQLQKLEEAEEAGGPIDLTPLRQRLAELSQEVEHYSEQGSQAQEEKNQLDTLRRHLQALSPLGVPLAALRDLQYVHLVTGLLPQRQLARLRESLAQTPHILLTADVPEPDGRILVTAAGLRDTQTALDRALRSAQFERIEIPPRLGGTPAEAMSEVDQQLAAGARHLEELAVSRQQLAEKLAPELRQLSAGLAREELLVRARSHMGASERTALITGWVPAVLARRLEQVVQQAAHGRCALQWRDPSGLEGVREGRVPVPILLHNPVLVRPFERMVRNYGLPRYGDIEPTAVMALGFLTMFGFMFGDVGQGLVLFALGYFIYRRMFRYRDYAIILMECGVFAVGFGFLYGSVFGVEDWLPALWLRPLDDMPRLMFAAVAFGAGFLSLGMVLNIVNALRRRDASIIWERNGLLVAVAYWMAIGLAARHFTAGERSNGLGAALLWLAVPVGLLLLKEPVAVLWQALRERHLPVFADMLGALIQSLIELLDTVLASIANTATFIRLAAFALSHAGLFLATFSIASAVKQAGGGLIALAAVHILGNAVIIALEGMIVSIQILRLEYYEFFSRFYSGGGEEYRPLHFAPTRLTRT
ncbi:MAG: hypothetical protein HY270_17420 [Deltaproteobacteria bacterium]|nr:hypothetical protein [Deltaproteobacteria bacterium]